MASEFKLVRSKVKPKPIEVNIDTVYIRTQYRKLDEVDGWEYKEQYMDKDEYFENLVTRTEHGFLSDMVQGLLPQIMDLQIQVIELNAKVDTLLAPKEPEPTPEPVQIKQITEAK